jgi:hypothetical protein
MLTAVRRARPFRLSMAAGSGMALGPGMALGLVLGLLALGPGLRRGFLLSYDMVFVPREPFTSAMFGLTGGAPRAVPSDFVVAVASRAIPADIVQKLVLLLIFVLACSGVAALLDREPLLARLAAGVFYTWNPYLAERLIIGQWALLLGYAGLPWVLRAMLKLDLDQGTSWRGTVRLAVALLPAVVGGFAAMAITALIVVPVAAVQAVKAVKAVNAVKAAKPVEAASSRRLAAAAMPLTALAVGSLPWLIPSVLHTVYADPAGVASFAARADTPFGTIGSLLMLGGTWNAQTVPKAYGGPWSAIWLAVVIAAVAGYVTLARKRWPGLTLAAVAGLVIASLGVTGPGQDLLRAAIGFWPGFAVLRDGQQFAAPLALTEAVGFGLAVAWALHPASFGTKNPGPEGPEGPEGLGNEHHARTRSDAPGLALAAIALLAPVLLLPGLAWGAAGRLRPAAYPGSWLAAARLIDASRAPGDVLLLPWVADRTPPWNHGEVMLDAWPRLVSRPVIWDDGTQVGDVRMAPDDPRARALNGVISSGGPSSGGRLTAALRAAGVRFVVVDGDTPAAARLAGWSIVVDVPDLVIYQSPG